jgi:hypothetical protein
MIMMPHRHATFLTTGAWLLVALGCANGQQTSVRSLPQELVPLPDAVNVRYTSENEGTVSYELNVQYPANTVVEALVKRLEMMGWRGLKYDVLNPEVPSSLISGWKFYEDATQRDERPVYRWMAQWEDVSGRIVWYTLKFEGPADSSGGPVGPLHITGTLFSADTASQMRKDPRRSARNWEVCRRGKGLSRV